MISIPSLPSVDGKLDSPFTSGTSFVSVGQEFFSFSVIENVLKYNFKEREGEGGEGREGGREEGRNEGRGREGGRKEGQQN